MEDTLRFVRMNILFAWLKISHVLNLVRLLLIGEKVQPESRTIIYNVQYAAVHATY